MSDRGQRDTDPGQNKKQREGLALLAAMLLDVRSANLMDLVASLPRQAERLDMRYQWISRVLGNAPIDVDEVMAPYVREILGRLVTDVVSKGQIADVILTDLLNRAS